MSESLLAGETPAATENGGGNARNLGLRFTVDVDGTLLGVNYWHPDTGAPAVVIVSAWRDSDDAEIAQETAGTLTGGQFNFVAFDTPPPLTATEGDYRVSINISGGSANFVDTSGGAASPRDNGSHLTAPSDHGCFDNASGVTKPDNNTNFLFFVDPVFEPESGETVVPVGLATETDTAHQLSRAKSRSLGQPSETGTAHTIGRAKTRTAGLAAEIGTAQPLGRVKTAALGQPTGTDTALPLGHAKGRALGVATETGSALTVTAVKTRVLGLPSTVDSAHPLAHTKTRTLGLVVEVDTALPLVDGTVIGLPLPADVVHYGGPQRTAHYGGPQRAVHYR